MKKEFDSAERTKPIKYLVIHSFALSPQKMIKRLHQYKLSVHYMIDSSGKKYQLLPENKVAWHAGPSFWAKESALNWTSIGIELEHLGFGQTDYPEKQVQTLEKLIKEIIERYQIRPENIIGHSDIAPEAKMDPGRGFPWQKLANDGIGLWYNLKNNEKISNLTVSEMLSLIGYNTNERALEASCWAFRQRFMPESVPIDNKVAEREKEVFKARQKLTKLSPKERGKYLKNMPVIYPSNSGTYLTDPDFIKTLKAVAYQYEQARKN